MIVDVAVDDSIRSFFLRSVELDVYARGKVDAEQYNKNDSKNVSAFIL